MTTVFEGGIIVHGFVGGEATTSRATVRTGTTVAGTLATDFENGDTIDGIILATDDRILIKNQADGTENGIYIVQSTGTPIRADDFYTGDNVAGICVIINMGTINSSTSWMCTNIMGGDIVDTDSLTFTQATGTGVDGNVNGPGTATTDNAIVRWNGADGTNIQNSTHTIGDNGEFTMTGTSAYIDMPDIVAPANPANGIGRLYKESGNAGLFWKPDSTNEAVNIAFTQYKKCVRVATHIDGTLATDFENGDTINGIVLATGDRILIKNQATLSENGIYVVNASGAPSRAVDLDTGSSASCTLVFCEEGDSSEHTGWYCINHDGADIVGTDNLRFDKVTGQTITANVPEMAEKKGNFTTATFFTFPGQNYTSHPHFIWVTTREDTGVTTELRVQDVTNAVSIATGTTTTGSLTHITELTVDHSAVPYDPAVWELQFRRATGAGNNAAYFSSITLILM